MKYLPLYYAWVNDGELPKSGLCANLGFNNELLELFIPDQDCMRGGYWGYYCEYFDSPKYTQDVTDALAHRLKFKFNPLRQNIVLFMAAMNNEL